MSELDFPEYAIRISKRARESRDSISNDMRPVVDEIEDLLCDDPRFAPERVFPVSRDGSVQVYRHPHPQIEVTFEVDENEKVIYVSHYSAPSFTVEPSIFISYAHDDAEWLSKLKKYLTSLEQQGLVKFWDDSQIQPGEQWEIEIKEALQTARAGLLLVTQNFMNSKFINETELPSLLEGAKNEGKQIFWLHLSPTDLEGSAITKFESLIDPERSIMELSEVEQMKAFVEVAKRLRGAIGQA